MNPCENCLADAKFFAKYSYGLFCGEELVGCATFACPQGSEALKKKMRERWIEQVRTAKKRMTDAGFCDDDLVFCVDRQTYSLLSDGMVDGKIEGVRVVCVEE